MALTVQEVRMQHQAVALQEQLAEQQEVALQELRQQDVLFQVQQHVQVLQQPEAQPLWTNAVMLL